jgi:hypothetical protein
LRQDVLVRRLPAAFRTVAVGGGGRYLIFHLPRLRKLVVFDVSATRLVHYVDLAEHDVKFAAGLDKLFIVLPRASRIQRWSLATFEQEADAQLPTTEPVQAAALGSACNGPLLLTVGKQGKFLILDGQSLAPLAAPPGAKDPGGAGASPLRMSANGRVLGWWDPNVGPSGVHCCTVTGGEMRSLPYVHEDRGHITPGPDGREIHTARGLYGLDGQRLAGQSDGGGYCVPAHHGNLDLTLPSGQTQGVFVHQIGQSRPVTKLPQVALVEGIDAWDREPIVADQRYHLIPQANLLIVLPTSNERLILYHFDTAQVLGKAGLDPQAALSR